MVPPWEFWAEFVIHEVVKIRITGIRARRKENENFMFFFAVKCKALYHGFM